MSNELQIKKLKNAFGISSLNVNYTSENINNSLHNNLIYAANGLFKTSFSKTFFNLSHNLLVEDRITKKSFDYDICINGSNINNIKLDDKIIVFTKDIMDEIKITDLNSELSKLAVSDELILKIKNIYNIIDEAYEELKSLILSLGYDISIIEIFTDIAPENRYLYLKSIVDNILTQDEICGKEVSIDKSMFSSETYGKLDNSDVRKEIDNIINYINNVQKETIFDENFTVFAAAELVDDLKKTSYLSESKHRGITLSDETYYSIEKFESILKGHISTILNTPDSIEKFEKIFRIIGNRKKEEKKLRRDILTNQNLINTLQYSRVQWISSELKMKYATEIAKIDELIKQQENEINEIKITAEITQSEFEKGIEVYEDRFNPVFKVLITNRTNAVLGIELPVFEFIHKSEPSIPIKEDGLLKVLSSGEKTAYNVLKFMVMYERVKNNKPLIILDDVVDSFDYGNRYAFIEYIKDMIDNDECNVLVLTNNYEFFRNLKLRVRKLKTLATTINQVGTITISCDKKLSFNTKDVFNIDCNDKLIASLPFAREIATYQNNENVFLQYFHFKRGTKRKTIGGLAKIIKKYYKHSTIIEIDKKAKYLDILDSLCKTIVSNRIDSFDISIKVILALGIRMKLEKILIRNDISITDTISSNQTAELVKLRTPKLKVAFIRLVNQIMVSTPEFIHLNAFMYEPLIDILPITLKKIYKKLDVFETDLGTVWKK